MNLPEQFLDNMKALLKEEYEPWLASYEKPSYQGFRLNSYKLKQADCSGILQSYEASPVPWISNGYYYNGQYRPSKDAYYYAGLYYLQEPSAMTPASILPVEPGDMILDVCAAPGGKSTELGSRLDGQGMLVSNDISNSRAKALLKNLELFGLPNICVTSEEPAKLAATFGMIFDGILVDAPCSGEGMFRKDPDLVKSWMEHGPEYYATIQTAILSQCAKMLKPGGHLLYSTCTFALVEDEDVIHSFLETHPDFTCVPITPWEGATSGLDGLPVIRLYPHKIKGEGHFIALLQKAGEKDATSLKKQSQKKDYEYLMNKTDFPTFQKLWRNKILETSVMIKDDQVYILPEGFDRTWKLRYLRTGLHLGSLKKGRFEPSQAFAMSMKRTDFSNTISFAHEDERVIRYLKGETITLQEEEMKKGWCLVCVEGHPLGWAKGTGMTLKNKYYPGWRWQ